MACTAARLRSLSACILAYAMVFTVGVLSSALLPNTVVAKTPSQTPPQAPPNPIRFAQLLDGRAGKDNAVHSANTILQDKTGFIWFAGEHGVARYDGHRLKHYRHQADNPTSLPSNVIWDGVIDASGVVWLATQEGLARYNPKTDSFMRYLHDAGDPNSLRSNTVRSLAVDADNNLLIGTRYGLSILDSTRKHFIHYAPELPPPYHLPDSGISTIYPDDNNILWLGTTDAGLIKLNTQDHSRTYFVADATQHQASLTSSPKAVIKATTKTGLPHNNVMSILRDGGGALWVGTFGGGIARLEHEGTDFDIFQHDEDDPTSLGSNTVWQLLIDHEKRLWVATAHGGLNLFNPKNNTFVRLKHNPYDPTSLLGDDVISLMEDERGDLWAGFYPIGIGHHDRSSESIRHATHRTNDPNSLNHPSILTIKPSLSGHLWIGTEAGLNLYNPQQHTNKRFKLPALNHQDQTASDQKQAQGDTKASAKAPTLKPVLAVEEQDNGDLWIGTWSGGVHRISADKTHKHFMPNNTPDSINSAYVWNMLPDKKGLWIGTETGGLNYFDYDSQQFRSLPVGLPASEYQTSNAYIKSLTRDHRGDIWIGTRSGLDRMYADTERMSHYYYDANDDNSLSNNNINTLYEDSARQLWVGTRGGGVSILNIERTQFERLTRADGLPSNNVASIRGDTYGDIWITTDEGTAIYHPSTQALSLMPSSRGMISNQFTRNASYTDANGNMYLGSTGGLSIIRPQELVQPEMLNVQLTELFIFHDEVNSATKNSPLKESITHTKGIKLGYDQRVLTLRFSSLDFRQRDGARYRYRLKGLDKSWGPPTETPQANYANLPAGEYQFQVVGQNTAGIWADTPTELSITILPPLWRTYWAYALYAVIAFLLIYLFSRYQKEQIQLRDERAVNAELLKLNTMKDAFLANTSHELRTPLNGIIGLAENLKVKLKQHLDSEDEQHFDMIADSGQRLSHLVSDILDSAKLKHGDIALTLKPTNLVPIAKTAFSLVKPLIGNKPIQLEQDLPEICHPVFADEGRLQQVLINLLSNAIKYSDQGTIALHISQEESTTTITIQDQGIGIREEDRQHIFESFSQVEHNDKRHYEGTGLGLSITQQLIKLHGSELSVKSNIGEGSTFSFALRTTPLPTNTPLNAHIENASPPPKLSNNPLTILIVDDNPVNLIVLTGLLKQHAAHVIEALNGKEALKLVRSRNDIDLIIMDIMMPEMDGYEACKIIRQTHSPQKLPIIFLTAKDIETIQKKALTVGGNAVISKPINKRELLRLIEQTF